MSKVSGLVRSVFDDGTFAVEGFPLSGTSIGCLAGSWRCLKDGRLLPTLLPRFRLPFLFSSMVSADR